MSVVDRNRAEVRAAFEAWAAGRGSVFDLPAYAAATGADA